mmetsp:Transcript_88542/g.157037  ORF Transcript_88542/g.157037 Transcript_88542/m.157037 type:complete len:80 (+) Transcript_88542:41-280(+)
MDAGATVVALLSRFPHVQHFKLKVALQGERHTRFWLGVEGAFQNKPRQFGQELVSLDLQGIPATENEQAYLRSEFPNLR